MKKYSNIELKKAFAEITPIINDNGFLKGLNFKFFPKNENQTIYETSEGNIVRDFPEELSTNGFSLDINSLNKLNSAMANTLSTYLFSYRKHLNGGDMSLNINSSIDSEMSARVFVPKYFFRDKGGNKGRYKVKISFVLNDDDFGSYEIINIPLTKTDIQVMFNIIKDIVTSFNRTQAIYIPAERISYEDEEYLYDVDIPYAKIDNSILIGDVWLHGQELLNLLYVIDKLIYSMYIEKDLNFLNTFYRQIKIINENGVLYIILNKKQNDHSDNPMIDNDGKEYKLKIPLSATLLSAMHMTLDIKVLRHADIDYELDPTIEILGNQDPFAKIKAMKYHISMKESAIGISVDTNNKCDNRIRLVGFVKDGAHQILTDDGEMKKSSFEKDGKIISVMDSFNINLKEQWPKLIKALSIAYTKEYITDEKDFNLIKFFVLDNAPGEKMFKYEFSILANKDNKANAVLTINKYDKEKLISSYRQPLFDKYLYQLIIMLISAGNFMENIGYTQELNKLDLIKYRYKSLKSVTRLTKNENIEYGIKKEGDDTYWGIFSDSNKMSDILPDQDKYMLHISALSRIIRGKWLPFVGETISVGPDRYITDLYGELETDENPEEYVGMEKPVRGLDWAIMIYFGTSPKV